MSIKLAVVILPGGNDVIIFEPTTLCEQLSIDVMEGLKAKALGSGVMEAGEQGAVQRVDSSGDYSTQNVSIFISTVQRIADRKKGIFEKVHSFKEGLLARDPAMVKEPD